jgi:hypothetical protein
MNKHEDPAIVASIERAAGGPITVDITTIGRRSGTAQRIEIWVVKIGDRLVIGGTPRPRDWLANLRVDSALTLHLKDDVIADLSYVAAEVSDLDVRREIWTHPSTEWYRARSSVEDLITTAPTVELTPPTS